MSISKQDGAELQAAGDHAGNVAHPRGLGRSFFAVFTLEDALLGAYLAIVSLLVLCCGTGPNLGAVALRLAACVAVMVISCVLARATDLPSRLRSVVYRASIVGVLVADYLMLRDLLPAVRPDSVDEFLWRLDERLFGGEPSLWLERLNQRPIVEWFSFFYYSYFFIAFTYMLVAIWLIKPGRLTSEFALGTLIVFCGGQLGYLAVPGYGPSLYLESHFQGPVDGGFFWGCVVAMVEAGCAMKDIFPSLHTAAPIWFTLFAFMQARRDERWRWPARITAFFAANIIFSTVFLRWHYAVDVIAGLALAAAAAALAPRLAARQERFRERLGLGRPWHFPPRHGAPTRPAQIRPHHPP